MFIRKESSQSLKELYSKKLLILEFIKMQKVFINFVIWYHILWLISVICWLAKVNIYFE